VVVVDAVAQEVKRAFAAALGNLEPHDALGVRLRHVVDDAERDVGRAGVETLAGLEGESDALVEGAQGVLRGAPRGQEVWADVVVNVATHRAGEEAASDCAQEEEFGTLAMRPKACPHTW